MFIRLSAVLRLGGAVAFISLAVVPASAQQGHPSALVATRSTIDALRAADAAVDSMIRDRSLIVRTVERDELMPDRVHERFDQYFHGVRIVGGDLTRQLSTDGTVSVFGTVHTDLTLDTTPALSSDDARDAIATAAGGTFSGATPELVVLPLSDGYHLAYSGQALVGVELMNVFVDAQSGGLLRQYSDFLREVGHGKGAYGDDKKVSAKTLGGAFVTDDPLRPAAITTYDMKGNLTRLLNLLNRVGAVVPSDIASDTDNEWTDSTVVDAHVYAGWYYDFLSKRFGRKGLDNRNLRIALFTHPVRQQDIFSASSGVVGTYYLNAFFCPSCLADGRGAMVFGEGAPANFIQGVTVKPFSAALDVLAHELTHGVTANSAALNGFPFSEAGALNEAFSDMFGAATAFFYEPPGAAPLTASYTLGRDLSIPPGVFSRSLSNPAEFGDPDHYSLRFIGGDPHYNSTIASHAFFLAIEGGTNRTSGRSVQGVGAANRDQVEKSFFRALTSLMPSSSTFGLTRVATIQAARDLYGLGSAAERAITQAWDAVGVQERTIPTATILPNPAVPTSSTSSLVNPQWLVGITASAGTSSLRITQWTFDFYDHRGSLLEHEVLSPVTFAQVFASCGPGSATVLAQTDACGTVCITLRGETNGATEIAINAIDDAGQAVVFTTPRTALAATK
jgi:Zn-dependent metalloprotease